MLCPAAACTRRPCNPTALVPTDFEKGFIRAETVAFDEFVAAGGYGTAKEKGLLRLEGKEYVVKEGDVMLFRFNV
jgi:obg-like ATPase 1